MNLHTNLDLTQNSAQKPEKLREKVAETAEISKTAPKIMVLSNKWRP